MKQRKEAQDNDNIVKQRKYCTHRELELKAKGYIEHNAFGKTHQYFPVISKEDYRKTFIKKAINNYFENSYKNVVSFFAKEEKISIEELKEIIELIEHKKNK